MNTAPSVMRAGQDPVRESTISDFVGETAAILNDTRQMLDEAFSFGNCAKEERPVAAGAVNRVRDLAEYNRDTARSIRSQVERLVAELR